MRVKVCWFKNEIDKLVYYINTNGKNIVGDVFGFNETISKLEAEKTLLFDNFESLKNSNGNSIRKMNLVIKQKLKSYKSF